jgi:hypothetical protein
VRPSNKTALLVVVAAVLLGLAVLLARCGQERLAGGPGPTAPKVRTVAYPRDKRPLPARPSSSASTAAAPAPAKKPDRLTQALASPGGDGAVVFEVNAIRHSPLVEKLLACEQARGGDGAQGIGELQQELGIDVTEDVDRLAFDKDVLAVSGFFGKLKLPAELGEGEAVGDNTRLYRVKNDEGKAMVVGRVGDELLLSGFDERQVRDAIERAEGRAAATGPGFPADLGGEVYGLLGPALMADLFGDAKDPMAARLAEVVRESRVQIAVDDAAALSLDLATRTPDEAQDLGKALGGAVTALRAQARQEGKDDLAGLLDQARVVVDERGSVAFDFAVPGDDLLRLMGCDPEGRLASPP